MNILIAVDSVEFNKVIAEFVNSHDWSSETNFRIVHVIEPALLNESEIAFLPFLNDLVENEKITSTQLVSDMAKRIDTANVNSAHVSTEVVEGHASDLIVQLAREWQADMLLVGSHGRKGMTRFVLGSVSSSVVALSPCSVVVLRLPITSKITENQESVITSL
ncbi:universal stress protein [soil metagenome]